MSGIVRPLAPFEFYQILVLVVAAVVQLPSWILMADPGIVNAALSTALPVRNAVMELSRVERACRDGKRMVVKVEVCV